MSQSIVVMCMQGASHLQLLLPIIEALRSRGRPVHVLTRSDLRPRVESVGGHFIDLFAGRSLEAADDASVPIGTRYVSFAGTYGESLAAEVAALKPALIVYDTSTVIAPVVAQLLGIPFVNVFPNHAPFPERAVTALRKDPRVSTSPAAWAAIKRLKAMHGMSDANPFSYLEALSPLLNVYGEPPEFLEGEDLDALQPLAFFGAVAPHLHNQKAASDFAPEKRGLRIYVAFGLQVWSYFEEAALAAFTTLANVFDELDVDVLMSLGGHKLDTKSLVRPNVRVVDDTDQWAALRDTDLFITHHGINSTHEAIFHAVPMLSYPFFGNQPALAQRCQDLGLAIPLASQPQQPLEPKNTLLALQRLIVERDEFTTRLTEARAWEMRTINDRDKVIDQMLALIGRNLGLMYH